MNPNDRLNIAPHVVARNVGEETVLLDLRAGVYFGLDPVGSKFLSLVDKGFSIEAACEVVLDEYDVDKETLYSDIQRLIEDLVKRQLIVLAS